MAAVLSRAPQQVNLLNPALMPATEHFSGRHLLTWILVAAVALVAVAWWAVTETRELREEMAETARNNPVSPGADAGPTPQQVAALEQSLQARKAMLEAKLATRDALTRGLSAHNGGPSAVMRIMADSIPASAWLTEVRVHGGRIDVVGKALDAAAVDAWLERLRNAGFLAAQPAASVKLERLETPPAARLPPTYSFQVSAPLALAFADDGARP
jgi:Tfp pilus assembly protein PilN